MLELRFEAAGVAPSAQSALPQVALGVRVRTVPRGALVRGLSLHTQVQIECAARSYSAVERERLRELFGCDAQWPDSLRSVLWTRLTTPVDGFEGERAIELELPCGADLELVASKYCFGLEGGELPLRLLFSGSILHGQERVQITPIALDSELALRVPVAVVHDAVERHHGGRMLLGLRRDVFEQLYRYRRERGLPSWEHVIERLLGETRAREDGP